MNISDMVKRAEVPITCPNCQQKVMQKLGRIYNNEALTCPECGVLMRFEDCKSIDEATQKADDALAGLVRTIEEVSNE